MKKSIVSIARNKNITYAVEQALDQLNIPNLSGKTVLLKPNVGREVDPNKAINTNPTVVQAVFHYLKEEFEANYLIGDSPIIATETKKAFYQSGYESLLKEEGLEFIDLDKRSPIVLSIPSGRILKKIEVTGYWNDFDFIISIPVLKMHMHTGASLSFKNLKGLIYGRKKILLHQLHAPEVKEQVIRQFNFNNNKIKELDIAIADLAQVFNPILAVIDASYVLEGMGPSSGNAVKMDTIIASTDFLAADITAIALTQPNWSLDNVPHLKIISQQEKPYGPMSLNDIITIPSNIEKFIIQLESPPSSISIKFNNVKLIDIDSCSSCLYSIFNLLKKNMELIDANFTKENPLRLAIGKGITDSDLINPTFLIGNCTAIRKSEGLFVQGCAPVQSDVLKVIKDYINDI